MVRIRLMTTKGRVGAVLALVVTTLAVGPASSSAKVAQLTHPAGVPAASGPCDRTVANSVCNEADSAQAEGIWQGRIHLGDEPGIYNDAQFFGATAELPISLQRTSAAGDNRARLIVETKDVQTFSGYPGHSITVILHVVDLATFQAKEVVLAKTRLTSADNNRKAIPIDLSGHQTPFFVSVQMRQDEQVPPGAQDDFLWTRLALLSPDFQFFANYGYNISPYSD